MSSSAKQQKRARRAKSKARQQRIQRNNEGFASQTDYRPGDYRDLDQYDDTLRSLFLERQALVRLIESCQPGEELPEAVLDFFRTVQQAEAIGLEEMLESIVKGPLGTPSVVQDILDQKLFRLLSLYWKWSEGLDDETILARVDAQAFDVALANVLSPVLNADDDDFSEPSEDELQAYLESMDDVILEHYAELQKAEAISQEAFLKAFLTSPLLPREDESGNPLSEEAFAEEFAIMLALYWEWSEGLDEAAAEERMLDEQFRQDLERALLSTQADAEGPRTRH